MMPPAESVLGEAQEAIANLREGLGELTDWRAMFGAAMVPDELKPEGEQALWPNPWRQDVAMVAYLVHTIRQDLAKATARVDWLLRERAVVERCEVRDSITYWLHWPDQQESQIERYPTPYDAIDAAMAVIP